MRTKVLTCAAVVWCFGVGSIRDLSAQSSTESPATEHSIASLAPPPSPPVAEQMPHETVVHGVALADEYAWLRKREDPVLGPKIMALLKAERAYSESATLHLEPLRTRLLEETRARTVESDLSVPWRRGAWLYATRTQAGKALPIHVRTPIGGGPEQVLIDPNLGAAGRSGYRVGTVEVSPDGNIAAITVDAAGDEKYVVTFRDLRTMTDLPDRIENTAGAIAWADDNATLFYTRADEKGRPATVRRHTLGAPGEDTQVFHEADESMLISLSRSRSGKFILISGASMDTAEWRVVPAAQPTRPARVILSKQRGVEYAIDHQGDEFVALINDTGPNFRMVRIPDDVTSREHWIESIPHDPATYLESLHAFEKHTVIFARRGGVARLLVAGRDGAPREVPMPEPAYSIWPGRNFEFGSGSFRFNYTSPITPVSRFEIDLATLERTLLKRDAVPGYDASRYTVEVIEARSRDGTMVPLTITYKRGLSRDGTSPALLLGYGAYGVSAFDSFRVENVALLERGFVLAEAHCRGGSDNGRTWYLDGKLLKKRNTFDDFIACAEHLIAQRYTSAGKLAITGGSAGGTLVAAAVTMRPDLFGAVVAHVPFVDVLNTLLDSSINYTVTEFDEWGNPGADKAAFDNIRSYSPYDNTRPARYPHILVLAGLNDPRVPYWEPAKWVQRLRAANTAESRIIFRIDTESGHFGKGDRYEALKESAYVQAFLLDALGVNEPGAVAR